MKNVSANNKSTHVNNLNNLNGNSDKVKALTFIRDIDEKNKKLMLSLKELKTSNKPLLRKSIEKNKLSSEKRTPSIEKKKTIKGNNMFRASHTAQKNKIIENPKPKEEIKKKEIIFINNIYDSDNVTKKILNGNKIENKANTNQKSNTKPNNDHIIDINNIFSSDNINIGNLNSMHVRSSSMFKPIDNIEDKNNNSKLKSNLMMASAGKIDT